MLRKDLDDLETDGQVGDWAEVVYKTTPIERNRGGN